MAVLYPSSNHGFGLGQRFHVLLVEDDNVTLKMVEQLLRKLDYKVSSAANGREALAVLNQHQCSEQPVELILTDILMPEVTGFDLINEVVHGVSYCNVPVVVMSSQDSQESVLQAFQAGAKDYLIKPVRRNELATLWQHVWRANQLKSGASARANIHEAGSKKQHAQDDKATKNSSDESTCINEEHSMMVSTGHRAKGTTTTSGTAQTMAFAHAQGSQRSQQTQQQEQLTDGGSSMQKADEQSGGEGSTPAAAASVHGHHHHHHGHHRGHHRHHARLQGDLHITTGGSSRTTAVSHFASSVAVHFDLNRCPAASGRTVGASSDTGAAEPGSTMTNVTNANQVVGTEPGSSGVVAEPMSKKQRLLQAALDRAQGPMGHVGEGEGQGTQRAESELEGPSQRQEALPASSHPSSLARPHAGRTQAADTAERVGSGTDRAPDGQSLGVSSSSSLPLALQELADMGAARQVGVKRSQRELARRAPNPYPYLAYVPEAQDDPGVTSVHAAAHGADSNAAHAPTSTREEAMEAEGVSVKHAAMSREGGLFSARKARAKAEAAASAVADVEPSTPAAMETAATPATDSNAAVAGSAAGTAAGGTAPGPGSGDGMGGSEEGSAEGDAVSPRSRAAFAGSTDDEIRAAQSLSMLRHSDRSAFTAFTVFLPSKTNGLQRVGSGMPSGANRGSEEAAAADAGAAGAGPMVTGTAGQMYAAAAALAAVLPQGFPAHYPQERLPLSTSPVPGPGSHGAAARVGFPPLGSEQSASSENLRSHHLANGPLMHSPGFETQAQGAMGAASASGIGAGPYGGMGGVIPRTALALPSMPSAQPGMPGSHLAAHQQHQHQHAVGFTGLPPPPGMPPFMLPGLAGQLPHPVYVPEPVLQLIAHLSGRPPSDLPLPEVTATTPTGPLAGALAAAGGVHLANLAALQVGAPRASTAQRLAAVAKYLLKRKHRNFDKKVRYESRKRLAEARPRVRGQFVKASAPPAQRSGSAGGSSGSATAAAAATPLTEDPEDYAEEDAGSDVM